MATSSFVCPICSKIFPNQSKFNAHVRYHAVEKPYKCNLCSQEFNSRSKLNVHIKCQHESFRYPYNKRFKCNVCAYKMWTENHLINHMRSHTGERPFKCTVDDCGMVFKLELTLKNHIKYRHSDERPLKCKFPGCLHTAKTDVNLIGHMKVHSDDRPYACPNPECRFRAKESNTIMRHLNTVHNRIQIFACSQCDFRTSRKDQLKIHRLRRHSTKKDFKCDYWQCTKAFKRSQDLKLHYSNRHEARNITCDHPGCTRKYANATALYKHKWAVHLKKIHACSNSSRSYRSNTARRLASHMITHDGRKEKLACSIKSCEYKGNNEQTLEQFYPTWHQLWSHFAVHTKEKPFRCGHCDFGSSDRTSVQRHVSAVHANRKFPFLILPLGNRECIHCKMTVSSGEFLVHSMSHFVPVVMIERLETICS